MSEDPVNPSWTDQYNVLRYLVSYLEREARDLAIAGEEDVGHRYVYLQARLSEWMPIRGPYVSRGIYISPSQPKQKRDRMVVRQLAWESGEDFKRVKAERIPWPSITVGYYDVPRSTKKGLLEKVEQLAAPWDYGSIPKLVANPALDQEGPVDATRLRKRRAIYSYVGLPISIVDIEFREGDDSRIDDAWTALWDSLSSVCASEPASQEYEPEYLVPPQRLADFLREAITERPPDP
jgi:hypothetical protein